jgi:hypothetical protein
MDISGYRGKVMQEELNACSVDRKQLHTHYDKTLWKEELRLAFIYNTYKIGAVYP